MRIVCAGLATVDLIYAVDRIPGVDEKVQAGAVEMAAGGPAANAAVTAALLGADVTLVSAVGAHPLGTLIRDDLDRYGVRLVDAAAGRDLPPPVSSITVLNGTGERTVVSRNAGDAAVGVPPGLDLDRADAVLVDGHHPALAVAAARAGRPLVVDAGSWRPVFAEILPYADLVACSAVFRPPDPELLAAVPHVAVTAGPDPVRWRSGGRSGELPVPPVPAVDTAGAGDVFHGALAVAVARDPEITDLPGALRYAVRVAGLRVTQRGPRAWRAAISASGRDRPPAPS
ncbi:MAG TPA: PfkB family carbohydrate kinase [Actinoplanes sp.]|nr:PfkB family carbohydrate kinase [Actinoplanes sp.]